MKYLEVKFLITINKEFNKNFKLDNVHIAIINRNNEFTITIQNTCNTDSDIIKIFCRIYEILYFSFGIFPEIERIKTDNDKVISDKEKIYNYYFIPIIYMSPKPEDNQIIIDLDSLLKIENFEDVLKKWMQIREKLNLQMNSFFVANSSKLRETNYVEIIIALILQSMEGFVTSLLKNKLLYQDEQISIRKKCVVKKYIKKYCHNLNEKEIENLSFQDKIKLMIEPYKNIILNKEMETNKNKNCQIYNNYTMFLNKCSNTRNYIAHIDVKKNIFDINEIEFYIKKLNYIYRLNILKLLKIDVLKNDDKIKKDINNLDVQIFQKIYLNKSKKCENCKAKNKCKYEDIKIKKFDEVIGDLYGRKVYKKRN